ncbi:MAG: DNA polymerase II [Kiritimatiellae bacterium]|nr:DNA polymerase II [Kiritimatiellia bacterium]
MSETESTVAASTWTPGFILSQEWQDTPAGCLLTFWGRGRAGPFELRVMARPVLFVPRECALPAGAEPAERRSLELRDFRGGEADVLYFHHARDLRAAREACATAGIPVFEGDINPASRYLMERFIHGCCEFTGAGLTHEGVAVYDHPRIRPGTWAPPLTSLYFDIETGSSGQLYSVAYVFRDGDRQTRQVYMLGHGQVRRDPPLRFCATEAELLRRFIEDVGTCDPDIVAGWNILSFDLPFLAEKGRECGLPLALGRCRLETRLRETAGRWQAEIPGRVVADGIPLLRGIGLALDNYRLETAAQTLLGEGKQLDFEGLDKQVEIDRLFGVERLRLASYNLHDAELVDRIFIKTGLNDLMVARSRITGLPPDRLGRSIAAFDYFFLPRLHRKGYVAPDQREIQESAEPLPGGLVLPPHAGVHEHVVVLDFKSLYPSLMRTFSICPYARLMQSRDPVVTPTGHHFSVTERILPDYIGELLNLRQQADAAGDRHLSQAIKTLMNSFYGVLGAPASRFYDPEIAQAITGSGQWVLRAARQHLESCGYKVLYGDTDSLFAQLTERDTAHPHTAGESLAASVNAFFKDELHERFHVTSALEMRFERYYRRLYLPLARHARPGAAAADEEGEGPVAEGAAKRYAGLVCHADGREELMVTGLESVRSDWTALAHRLQREALNRFFHGEPLADWLREEVTRLRAGAHDDELVYRRRLRKPLSAYTQNVPPHVRAARLLPAGLQRHLGAVEYVVTLRGPMPLALPHDDYDYGHYIDRQIRPVVEELLELTGRTFAGALSGQEQMQLL